MTHETPVEISELHVCTFLDGEALLVTFSPLFTPCCLNECLNRLQRPRLEVG